ncbi:MAG: LamG-like jellyroll fold domain-containing protein [Candidatus Sedimenticola sp. (ex Thyasira tokunagai)]
MSNDLTKEGSVTFWIRLEKNPYFKSENSNITFMHEKDVGGVKLTIVKENIVMRVIIDNSLYGISRMESDISKKLSEDMMIAITWSKESAKLYVNGKPVAESMYV